MIENRIFNTVRYADAVATIKHWREEKLMAVITINGSEEPYLVTLEYSNSLNRYLIKDCITRFKGAAYNDIHVHEVIKGLDPLYLQPEAEWVYKESGRLTHVIGAEIYENKLRIMFNPEDTCSITETMGYITAFTEHAKNKIISKSVKSFPDRVDWLNIYSVEKYRMEPTGKIATINTHEVQRQAPAEAGRQGTDSCISQRRKSSIETEVGHLSYQPQARRQKGGARIAQGDISF